MTLLPVQSAPPAQFAPVPFTALLRAEGRKATSTRAARWLLAAIAVITIGGLAIPLTFPDQVTQSWASYLTWAGLGLSRLLPIVLMLAMTAEWSQRTALTTFTQEPRRGRVLAAKIVTGLGISLVGAAYALGVTELVITVARAAGRHIASGLSWSQLVGFVVFVLLTSAIGIAFGALLHNTAVAIVTYVALAGAFSLLMIPALQAAGDWLNTGQTYSWLLDGRWAGHAGQIATSTLLSVVLPLAAGIVRTQRREVR